MIYSSLNKIAVNDVRIPYLRSSCSSCAFTLCSGERRGAENENIRYILQHKFYVRVMFKGEKAKSLDTLQHKLCVHAMLRREKTKRLEI